MLVAALSAASPPAAATYCSTMYLAFDTSCKQNDLDY
jgi:hypothetical protein